MMNKDLFTAPYASSNIFEALDLPDGDAVIAPAFFSQTKADELMTKLVDEIAWQQADISMYGKVHKLPRLMAWYGESRKRYRFSGISSYALPWTSTLLEIKSQIEPYADTGFNTVLANFYRDESDGVAWHSDDEAELGRNPIIASLSLGEERVFQLKHRTNKGLKRAIKLPHGACLIMRGETQKNWLHQIPKSRRPVGPRINLTYRWVR